MTETKHIDWYLPRVEYMAQFMTEERYRVLRRTADHRTRWITLCMENTFHPQNASALVRTAEAFGIQDIHAVQELCKFRPNVNIVRGTDKWVDLHRHTSSAEALSALRAAGYRIVATSPRPGGHTPESFDVAASPFALVFGTEHAGISSEVTRTADEFISIPMCGMVESLNVSASASILLYMLSSRLRQSTAPWQINDAQKTEMLFRWVMESVRDSERILAKYKE